MTPANAGRQPTVQVRITHRDPPPHFDIDEIDAIGLRCFVTLQVTTGAGAVVPVRFLVDSGAMFSSIPIRVAELRGLVIPPVQAERTWTFSTAAGTTSFRARPGRMRVWWTPGRRGYPFDIPLYFKDAPAGVPPLLGLRGVVRLCRWTIDGQPSPGFEYGHVLLEDTR